MGLSTRDLRGALAFVADAHDVDAPEPLTKELLDRLTELVGCEYVTYQEIDWARQTFTAYVWCSNEDPLAPPPPYVPDEVWTTREGYKRPPPAPPKFAKSSDRLDRRERERIRDEEEFNAEFRLIDRLDIRVGQTRTRSAWLSFESQERDFDERDRKLALALLPHAEALWHRAVLRTRLAELLTVLGRDDVGAGRAIVVYEPDGRIDHGTAEAQRLLAAWFGTGNSRLPSELDEWVAVARPGDRYTEHRNGSMLTVEAIGDFTLILRSQHSEIAKLTPREREILDLVAEGRTNAEIALSLWVAPSTVAKHLQQAYAKLGVHSRTAAIARLAKPAS